MFDSPTCTSKKGTPLKSYDSELEADEAAEYVKYQYKNEQVKYKCQKCGYWHLSPKERQTPNHVSTCLDSDGKPKHAYPTRETAEKRAEIIFQEKGIKLSVYQCGSCHEWHLTHKK